METSFGRNPEAGLAPPLRFVDSTHVHCGGRQLCYFGGCDYFRLSRHPKVLGALSQGLRAEGLNASASRMTTGNHPVYQRLERELARFFDCRSATLVSAGYLSNLVAAQALAGEFTHALIDERAHSSLHDAVLFLRCPTHSFRHQSVPDAARVARRCGPRARLVLLTDGVFAHDGSVAPLDGYSRILSKRGVDFPKGMFGFGLGRGGGGRLSAQWS